MSVLKYAPEAEVTGSVNNLGTPCRLLPLPPFAMLKRLEHVLFSVKNASGLYNIERGKGYHLQRCQMSQELLTETVGTPNCNIFVIQK